MTNDADQGFEKYFQGVSDSLFLAIRFDVIDKHVPIKCPHIFLNLFSGTLLPRISKTVRQLRRAIRHRRIMEENQLR
jgi:hypothetical protein